MTEAAPWEGRPEWKAGVIPDRSHRTAVVLWLFGGVWTAVSGAALAGVAIDPDEDPRLVLFLAFFTLVGAGVLAGALYLTARRRRFGQVECRLVSRPGRVGGELAAVVVAARGLPVGTVVTAALRCTRHERVMVGGKPSTRVTEVWATETRAVAQAIEGGIAFPVRIPVPEGLPESTASLTASWRHVWSLTCAGVIEGVDFAAEFEVPVYAGG